MNIPAAAAAALKEAYKVPEATSSGYLPHVCTQGELDLMQCALQHALKASQMSASEVKRLKNRNNLLGSEDPEHTARSHSHQSICQWGYPRAHFKIC